MLHCPDSTTYMAWKYWILTEATSSKHTNSFEMWQMLSISWTDRLINEEVLLRINSDLQLIAKIVRNRTRRRYLPITEGISISRTENELRLFHPVINFWNFYEAI